MDMLSLLDWDGCSGPGHRFRPVQLQPRGTAGDQESGIDVFHPATGMGPGPRWTERMAYNGLMPSTRIC
jgi:hypothetical protein